MRIPVVLSEDPRRKVYPKNWENMRENCGRGSSLWDKLGNYLRKSRITRMMFFFCAGGMFC